MASPQNLTWTLNLERGTINFGRTIPFAGNTYNITLEGGEERQQYVIYVMANDGVTCLAKSSYNGTTYSIAFNSISLREEFERAPHEAITFHCYIRNASIESGVAEEVSTVAESELTILWNPLWTEAETGDAFTMQGPPGKPGKDGDPGKPGTDGKSLTWSDLTEEQKASLKGEAFTWDDLTDEQKLALKGEKGDRLKWEDLTEEQKHSLKGDKGDTAAHDLVPCDEDGQFYRLVAVKNENGEMVLALEQEQSGMTPSGGLDGNAVVLTTTDQTIDGVKTFEKKIKGTIENADAATKATQDGNGKVISSTYLPLAGGKMTGVISFGFSGGGITNTSGGGSIVMRGGTGWDNGASIYLNHTNNDVSGVFEIVAHNGTSFAKLVGKPDSTLTWKEKNLVRSVNGTNADAAGNVVLPLNFVPLAGGTMTGGIEFNKDVYIKKSNSTGYLALAGGAEGYNGGGAIVLRGKNAQSGNKGEIVLATFDGTNRKSLNLQPNGLLTWGGKNVAIEGDCLPSNGGTVTGPIIGAALSEGNGKSLLLFTGENNFDGATIQMFEKAHPNYAGKFYLRASTKSSSNDTSGSSCDLIGSPNGDLTWGANPVAINNKAMTTTGLTLKGNVTVSPQSGVVELAMQSDADTKAIRLSGGTGWGNGGSVVVYGKNHTSAPGQFRLKASNGTTQAILEGKPDGTLQWGNLNVVRSIRGIKADQTGNVWLEFLKLMDSSYSRDSQGPMLSIGDPSGLSFVMQSGVVESVDATDGATVTFDIPFRDTDYVVICQQIKDAATGGVAVKSKTTTGFTLDTYSNGIDVMWFAFGYPKN